MVVVDLDFADDLALLSYNKQQMQEKTDVVSTISSHLGLNINRAKTKILKIKSSSKDPVMLNGSALEEVQSFTYLGSGIDQQGGTDVHFKPRTGKARAAYIQLKNIWSSKRHVLDSRSTCLTPM